MIQRAPANLLQSRYADRLLTTVNSRRPRIHIPGEASVVNRPVQVRIHWGCLTRVMDFGLPVEWHGPLRRRYNWDAVLVEQADHLVISSEVGLRVAPVTRSRPCEICIRAVAQPIVIDPACPGTKCTTTSGREFYGF